MAAPVYLCSFRPRTLPVETCPMPRQGQREATTEGKGLSNPCHLETHHKKWGLTHWQEGWVGPAPPSESAGLSPRLGSARLLSSHPFLLPRSLPLASSLLSSLENFGHPNWGVVVPLMHTLTHCKPPFLHLLMKSLDKILSRWLPTAIQSHCWSHHPFSRPNVGP